MAKDKQKVKKTAITISLHPDTQRELAALAQKSRMTRSGYIEWAVRRYYRMEMGLEADFGPGKRPLVSLEPEASL